MTTRCDRQVGAVPNDLANTEDIEILRGLRMD
jgi:hypothetical protein